MTSSPPSCSCPGTGPSGNTSDRTGPSSGRVASPIPSSILGQLSDNAHQNNGKDNMRRAGFLSAAPKAPRAMLACQNRRPPIRALQSANWRVRTAAPPNALPTPKVPLVGTVLRALAVPKPRELPVADRREVVLGDPQEPMRDPREMPSPAMVPPVPVRSPPPAMLAEVRQPQPDFHLPKASRPTPFGRNSLKPYEYPSVLDEWAADARSDHTGFQFDQVVACGMESFEKRVKRDRGEAHEEVGFVW